LHPSVPLRKQLIALADRAGAVSRQQGQEKEAAALFEALTQAIDLASAPPAQQGPGDRIALSDHAQLSISTPKQEH